MAVKDREVTRPNSQAAKVVASGDDLSALSTSAGSTSAAGPSCASWPSAKVIDALRTVDSPGSSGGKITIVSQCGASCASGGRQRPFHEGLCHPRELRSGGAEWSKRSKWSTSLSRWDAGTCTSCTFQGDTQYTKLGGGHLQAALKCLGEITGHEAETGATAVPGFGAFRNWLEWVQNSKKIMGFKPTVDFLNLCASPNTSLQIYLRAIIHEVMRTLDADRCSIFFVDDMRKEEPFKLDWAKGIVGMVANEGQIVNLPDAHDHPSFDGEIEKKTGYRVKGLLSLPVKSTINLERTIGVIQVLNKRKGSGSFSEQDAVELQQIAMVIGDSFYRQRWKALEKVFEKGDEQVSAVLNEHRERPVYSSNGPGMSTPPEILRSISRQPFLRAHSPLQVEDLVSLNFDVLTQTEDFLEELVPDILRHAGCIENCKIPEERLMTWAEAVHQGYRENSFHNWYHGFGVYQMCFHQLSLIDTFSGLTATEGFGLLVASLCHDIDHPGVTNGYLIRQQDDLALRYNDVSVLENHHASVACTILRAEKTNISSGLEKAEQGVFRKAIIKCILATEPWHGELKTQGWGKC
eukprot:s2954_g1.t1